MVHAQLRCNRSQVQCVKKHLRCDPCYTLHDLHGTHQVPGYTRRDENLNWLNHLHFHTRPPQEAWYSLDDPDVVFALLFSWRCAREHVHNPFPWWEMLHRFCLWTCGTVAKRCCDHRQNIQSWICVHMEFGETMPVSQIKQKFKNTCVMWFGQEVIKKQYSTLW